MKNFSSTVAAEVRAAFARRGEGVKELATVIDVSLPTARGRWNSETPLSVDELFRIAEYLEVPLGALMSTAAAA